MGDLGGGNAVKDGVGTGKSTSPGKGEKGTQRRDEIIIERKCKNLKREHSKPNAYLEGE